MNALMTKPKLLKSALAFSVLLALTACQSSGVSAKVRAKPLPVPTAAKGEVVVTLKPSAVTREGKIVFTKEWFLKPSFNRPVDEMNEGKLKVDGEDVVFYIPRYGPYELTSKEDENDNGSMRISVDVDKNGYLDNTESWFSSLPVRIADSMFQVRSVDPGGTWIKLAKADVPLAGLVVGKPCPDFEFYTSSGNKVTLADYKGKNLLLDIWSMT